MYYSGTLTIWVTAQNQWAQAWQWKQAWERESTLVGALTSVEFRFGGDDVMYGRIQNLYIDTTIRVDGKPSRFHGSLWAIFVWQHRLQYREVGIDAW
jgi:hypothetical protein